MTLPPWPSGLAAVSPTVRRNGTDGLCGCCDAANADLDRLACQTHIVEIVFSCARASHTEMPLVHGGCENMISQSIGPAFVLSKVDTHTGCAARKVCESPYIHGCRCPGKRVRQPPSYLSAKEISDVRRDGRCGTPIAHAARQHCRRQLPQPDALQNFIKST